MTKDYYSSGKRAVINGAPCWVPAWWGELGNDAEYREATKPRTAYKTRYYAGGHRIMVDGVPIRVVEHVKTWSPWMKKAIGKGSITPREDLEVKAQTAKLFPSFPPALESPQS